MENYEALGIVEALRSGVASRRLSTIFSYGREGLLEQVQQDLDAVARGRNVRFLILRGDYGEGKTHCLNTIFNLAQERGFVVSFVVLSKETPFNRMDRVYPKVACATYLPRAEEPGMEALLRDIRSGSALSEEILEFARQELHPKIFYILQNYFNTNDPFHQYLLSGDLNGEWLPVSQLKSMHRLNFGRPAKIDRFKPADHAWDYFRLMAHLIKKRGFAGWVLLFDELELTGTLSLLARANAFYNLSRFTFPQSADALSSVYPVFSVASRFWPDILLRARRPDVDEIPARLIAKGEPRKAEQAKRVLNSFLQETVTLEALPKADVRRCLGAVQDLHGRAYGWEPEADLEQILELTRYARLRTKIRYTLEYLDLKYLYREEPAVETTSLEEMPLETADGSYDEDDG
ncbi:MAG: BREX system ATP-binding domain-containing protein [Bacillota bacterium]